MARFLPETTPVCVCVFVNATMHLYVCTVLAQGHRCTCWAHNSSVNDLYPKKSRFECFFHCHSDGGENSALPSAWHACVIDKIKNASWSLLKTWLFSKLTFGNYAVLTWQQLYLCKLCRCLHVRRLWRRRGWSEWSNKAWWRAVVRLCLRAMKYSDSVHAANKTVWMCSWVTLDLWVQAGVGGGRIRK